MMFRHHKRNLVAGVLITLLAARISANDFVAIDSADSEKTAVAAHTREFWHASRVVGFPDSPPPFQVQRVFKNADLPKPLSVTVLPGTDDLLVTVHEGGYAGPGRLLRMASDESTATATEFLQIADIIYGVAFHPDFATNGLMYVGCNGHSEALDKKATRVLRFDVSRTPPFECDAKSQTVIIEWASNGHNGGDLVFGHDDMLYVSAGDGTSDSDGKHAGQDLTDIPGSMIRIDVDHPSSDKPYSIPEDNPFVDIKGACPEIWAYGLRNPWRICIDSKTGDLWAGNNGQDLWETVHVVRRGENYGWSITEGNYPFQPNRQKGPTPIVPPTIEHPHSEARSLTGGHVYYGTKHPKLYGHYIYGDYSTGMIWAAKYDGTTVTSHFLAARTSLQISGFGVDHDGELLIVDYGSGVYRFVSNEEGTSTNFPRLLSETGIFTSVTKHEVAPGIVPYQVNAPLWSDGAEKQRFIGLPGDAKIGFRDKASWNFPDGTVLVKTFSLPLTGRTTETLSRIETRLMTRHRGEWYGYSYQWNQEQTDAVLVESAGKHVDFSVADEKDASATRKQSWYYPSRSDCMVCHSRAASYVLGLSVLQTNRNVAHGNGEVSQLDFFQSLGLFQKFDETKNEAASLKGGIVNGEKAFELPAPSSELPRLVNPYDDNHPLEARVRSYLDTNCAHCHVKEGGGNSSLSLSFTGPLDKTGLINEPPAHDAFGMTDAKLVVPNAPHRSLLLHRIQQRGRGQMPPLSTSVVDQRAVSLIEDWIESLDDATVILDDEAK